MASRCGALLVAILFSVFPAGYAQTSPKTLPNTPATPPAKADYSQEAAVVEEMSTKISFANDGTDTREQTTRVRVQTDAGVQQWGLLTFPFQSAIQTVEIAYVRVRKPDGSTLVTPPDNVQDLDAEITRTAPFYSDLREKHVAVKGLAAGDTLEYEARWHTTKSLIPGQFWFQYSFRHEGIVLDERLEVSMPSGRVVKVKGPQATQSERTEGDARVYTWTYSRVKENENKGSENEKQKTDAALGRLSAPDIEISSFQSWDEVGRWYWGLQKDRVEPTPAIRAKAAELTQGMTDDADKLRALYSFVSTRYRYIGIAFGIGRYQPHAADDVLTNNYGDCKDKHTLLASLLQASGITLYPALINSSRKLDLDIPSPAQFDHIIGYLPQGKAGVWLDTTTEVGPYGYIVPRLRDKQALVILSENSAQLIATPADPPFASFQRFKIGGKLNEDGSFEAQVDDSARSDGEVLLRAAFRSLPQAQWKDLVQQISYGLGYAGTVSDVSVNSVESTAEPFRFSYSYHRKDYPDWSNHQFTVPGLPFYMPPVRDDAKEPVWLGPPLETVSDSKVELPKGYKPLLPSNVDLKYDFAEYHATYSQDHGVLIAERKLLVKMHEVPVVDFEDYRNFVKQLENDINRYVQTSSTAEVPFSSPQPPATMLSLIAAVRSLPDSNSAEANRLETDARGSMEGTDRSTAIATFKRALEKDPKFTRAWIELAVAQMASGKVESALGAVRQAIDSDPQQAVPRKTYALMLSGLRRTDEALAAWRDTVKVAPEDPDANAALGRLLLQQMRYAEAVPYLEVAAKANHTPTTEVALGMAYLHAGQTEKGTDTLQAVLKEHSEPVMLNDVGYSLADAKVDLDLALQYTQRAVEGQENESYDIELDHLLPNDLECTEKIGMFWDSLGWAHFRLGHLQQAEDYLYAAWLLTQDVAVGNHLGQAYEQEKKTEKAIRMYRLALSTPQGRTSGGDGDEIRHRLQQLTGDKPPPGMEAIRSDLGGELSQLRSAKLKRLVPGSASAEFFLLFTPGPKIQDVQFISGSEKLKSAGNALSGAKFQVAFPQGSSAHLLRRAIVSCSEVTGCEAVLLLPNDVHSVH
ncbi:MAG TPA: DUF3857 domain-containing protein [Candidatus Aquilonibacter sp.]|nr:DUF3857 domain-containing protein [Candidatus Aquilonibacter sp.]